MNYFKLKKETLSFYKKIKKINSPAFDEENIYFTRVGFDHLVRKGRTKRSKKEQIHRFRLFRFVKQIVSNKEATILFRETIRGSSRAYFWTFVETIRGLKIKVVIRQIDGGTKHFFSIMGSGTKKSPR